MSHVVDSCRLAKLNGGLPQLHSSDADARCRCMADHVW